MDNILIKNGRVWDGEKFLQADVLAEDGIISQIEQNIRCDKALIFDAAGMTVTPGLIDAHAHFKGISSDLYGTPADASCFPFGVTAAIDAGAELGDRSVLDTFAVKNGVFVCTEIKNNRPDLEGAARLLKQYGSKSLGLKTYYSGAEILDATPLEQICRFAHGQGLSVMVHCTGSKIPMTDILSTLDAGDILTHAFHGGRNSAREDNFESMLCAQKRGVWIDAGFAGHVHTDFSVLKAAVEAGVKPDIISTDITKKSAFTRGGRYGMTMCMSMARTAGMGEADIFRAVTTAPAAALGKAAQWGQLKPGAVADLAVLAYTDEGFSLQDKAGNRLENTNSYRCMLTVADGQIVYRY